MPFSDAEIRKSIESCPRLGSLRRINSTFQDLATADQDYTGQIAEIIRRDPSLTARLLQMVNSVFFGFTEKVNSVQDAVFYLGTKQIRQMALATPVLEDLQRFTDKAPDVDWNSFWRQSIGCAIMTRELLSYSEHSAQGDSDYVSGLIHGVGHLVALYAFTPEMHRIIRMAPSTEQEMLTLQQQIIGWDHTMIAAHYLMSHNIPAEVTHPVRHQNEPMLASEFRAEAAAVYVAKRMIGSLEPKKEENSDEETTATSDTEEASDVHSGPFKIPMPNMPYWEECPELHFILKADTDANAFTLTSLRYSLNQLPDMLRGYL